MSKRYNYSRRKYSDSAALMSDVGDVDEYEFMQNDLDRRNRRREDHAASARNRFDDYDEDAWISSREFYRKVDEYLPDDYEH